MMNGASFAMMSGGTKNLLCDVAVQCYTNPAERTIDWRRASMFGGFGFGYVGGVQYVLLNRIFPAVIKDFSDCPLKRTAKAIRTAVFLDCCVHVPFLYLPVFYSLRAWALHPELSTRAALECGFRSYQENVWSDALLQASIFIPLQYANFRYSPPAMRVPVLVGAGAMWASLLSYLHGSGDEQAIEASSSVNTGLGRLLEQLAATRVSQYRNDWIVNSVKTCGSDWVEGQVERDWERRCSLNHKDRTTK